LPKTRRENLKIIGAISATCAFPFSADELYGQHAHRAGKQVNARPHIFTEDELKAISVLADVIIPPTDTPGASEAGVPAYIDLVAAGNRTVRDAIHTGLRALDAACRSRFDKPLTGAGEAQLTELLTPLEVPEPGSDLEKFFAVFKSVTADGYYSSEIGLTRELGYKGNTILDRFPECAVPEH
jgi:hypothetical protein